MTEVPIIYKTSQLLYKSMDWFLYDRDTRREKTKNVLNNSKNS